MPLKKETKPNHIQQFNFDLKHVTKILSLPLKNHVQLSYLLNVYLFELSILWRWKTNWMSRSLQLATRMIYLIEPQLVHSSCYYFLFIKPCNTVIIWEQSITYNRTCLSTKDSFSQSLPAQFPGKKLFCMGVAFQGKCSEVKEVDLQLNWYEF